MPMCKLIRQGETMATNLAIDDRLIEQARRVGKHRTKKDAVTVALQEYIKLQRRRGLLALEGQIDFWPGYDSKDLRSKRRPG
jgi:Arc/MetJ family transcription regulator